MFGKYEREEDIPENERKWYALGDKFRPVESIDFVDILFNKRWPVKIPRFLHEYHDWWDYWEKECHDSMAEKLRPGMLLYDIGSFDGWQSAVFSQMIGGPRNMVLVEPCSDEWPNAKLTWEKNGLEPPAGAFLGFVGNESRGIPAFACNSWPDGPDYSKILKGIKFKQLFDPTDDAIPCVTIDVLSSLFGIPEALHIDVEGAELRALEGARATLAKSRPLVWVAIHPEFMSARYLDNQAEIHMLMEDLNYRGNLLATDHEEHWFFEPEELCAK